MSTETAKLEVGDRVWIRGYRWRIFEVGHYVTFENPYGEHVWVRNGGVTLYNGEWWIKPSYEIYHGDPPKIPTS